MSSAFTIMQSGGRSFRVVDLSGFAGDRLNKLPHVLRILLENALRCAGEDGPRAGSAILAWLDHATSEEEIPFSPSRVLMHDTTCVPALVDIAGMRSALAEAGHDPSRLNPVLPVDVSVDHSLAVDFYGTPDAATRNMARERERNNERYRFMKWAANTMQGVRVHPPGTGIMHTINLERLATVVREETRGGVTYAMPDTLIGTDSHTPMINGIGVLAWGVGGLEAESVMMGQPVSLRVPDVVGVKLTGRLREGVLATDLVLSVTQALRAINLSGEYVEFFGPGMSTLSCGERAVVANMAPEYGASSGFFPVDPNTLAYLAQTGRAENAIKLVEDYAKTQSLWFDPGANPHFTRSIVIDLGSIETSLAGPHRPQDRLHPSQMRVALAPLIEARSPASPGHPPHGAVALAAITSCTNTSDPRLTIAAGLLARKARALGLKPPAWVKTSLAPGSPTAARYLARAGLDKDLAALGFDIVGYGCTTCIGNAGPLSDVMLASMETDKTFPVAVLSGNRNFPGRVHAQIDAGFLASPPMVVAYALAGDIDRDILKGAIGQSANGKPIFLADLWPTGAEIDEALARATDPADIALSYRQAEASPSWAALEAPNTPLFPWDEASTYIRRPPFAAASQASHLGHYTAHPLLVLGDDVTTDHISPAGQIPAASDAADYLVAHGQSRDDLNVYAARRGNFEVMWRGIFTNRALKNLLAVGLPPGHTRHSPSGAVLPVWKAAARYAENKTPIIVIAGERYGAGSSRDWAAKGAALLGLRAVLALSFERIHRTNLIGMGILPIRLAAKHTPLNLALKPGDRIEIEAHAATLTPRAPVPVTLHRAGGKTESLEAYAAVETALEIRTLKAGGIIPLLLQQLGV